MTEDMSLYMHLLLIPTEEQPVQLESSYRQSKAKKFDSLVTEYSHITIPYLQHAQAFNIQLAFFVCSQIIICFNV